MKAVPAEIHHGKKITFDSIRTYLRRFGNLAIDVINQVRWGGRFYRFGWRSRLRSCDMLTNPQMISIGSKVLIRKHARLEAIGPPDGNAPKITVGDGTGVQFYFHCGAIESVTIGKNVVIGGRVFISDHDHVYDHNKSGIQSRMLRSKPVVIEDGAWLCEGAVILKGVTIGSGAVVGANAVVTKDVPAGTVVGGVPARFIRDAAAPRRDDRTKLTRL